MIKSWRANAQNRWNGLNLSTRLTAILATTLVIVLFISIVGTAPLARKYMVRQVDTQVSEMLDDSLDKFRAARISADWQAPGTFTLFYVNDPAEVVQAFPGRRTELPSQVPAFTYEDAIDRGTEVFTWHDPTSGREWRMAVMPVQYNTVSGELGAVIVGQDTGPLRKLILQQIIAVGLLSVSVTLLGLLFGAWAIRRAFTPLKEVESSAQTIAAGQLSHRVPDFPTGTEMGSLSGALNHMLGQIEGAFQSQRASEQRTRRFAADASHELRTPLASIRGFAELYRLGAIAPEDIERTFGRIEDESKRMGELVEELLLLARLDENQPLTKDEVDVAVLGQDAVFDAKALAPSRQIRLVGLGENGATRGLVWGDENALRQVVTNLVSNALRHTPADSAVELAVGAGTGVTGPGAGADRVVIEVRDHGSGLDRETAKKVFERFFREDSSRNRSTGGSGLGLSIAAAIVHAHDGLIGYTDTSGGGATFRVSLPVYERNVSSVDGVPAQDASAEPLTKTEEEPAHTGDDSV